MNRVVVAVGDVHGCIDELQELLKLLSYDPNQMRLILLGDLMDRGPDPVGCVRFVRELNVECVKGNHEDKHVRWRKHEVKRMQTGKDNPMKKLSKIARQQNEALSEAEMQWMKNLPVKLDLGNGFWAVHAGCEPRATLADQSYNQIMRVRYVNHKGRGVPLNADKTAPENTVYWTERWNGPESIVYGHCIHDSYNARIDEHDGTICVGIDTGCCFGGHLTAAVFNTNGIEFARVKAKQIYHERSDLSE
jgi:hypothetical protein